ncbi:hypothetical protein [Streptomyces sp. NPDC088733]|uniref:hypothetical protein n=1 Tax=Streptomyces sp. NPDC088733 TaxID=3365880 RepID=UPI003829C853
MRGAPVRDLLVAPSITKKATVTGTVRTGSEVTCSAAWSGYHATGVWSWLRDGRTVPGATGTARTLTPDDYTHTISCRVVVGNGAGSVGSTSPAVPVGAGPSPKAVKAPSLSGTPGVGHRLTAGHGTWSPAATSYSYSWRRDGKAITGATASGYVLVKADRGRKITVTVTAHRYGWTNGSATTAPAAVH